MKKYLVPLFLQKIDKNLLEKYPVIWETNVHYFIFYAVAINLILIIIAFLMPISQKGVVRFEYQIFEMYLLLYIPIIVFASWRAIKNLQFTLKITFLRFLMCILIAFLWNFTLKIIPNIIYWRVLMMYDKKQVEEDAFYVFKTRLLSDFIQKIYFLPEREQYLSTLRKSYFNQHNEIDEILNQIRLNEAKINKHYEILKLINLNKTEKDKHDKILRKIRLDETENEIMNDKRNEINELSNKMLLNEKKIDSLQEILRSEKLYSIEHLVKISHNYLDKIIKSYPPTTQSSRDHHCKVDENKILNIAEHLYLLERWSIQFHHFHRIQNKLLFDKVYPCSIKSNANNIEKKQYEECKKYQELRNGLENYFSKQQDEKLHKMNLILVEKMLDFTKLKKIFSEEPEKHKERMRDTDRLKLLVLAYWFLFPMVLLLGRCIRLINVIRFFGVIFSFIIIFGSLLQVFNYTSDYISLQGYFILLIFVDIVLFFIIHFLNSFQNEQLEESTIPK